VIENNTSVIENKAQVLRIIERSIQQHRLQSKGANPAGPSRNTFFSFTLLHVQLLPILNTKQGAYQIMRRTCADAKNMATILPVKRHPPNRKRAASSSRHHFLPYLVSAPHHTFDLLASHLHGSFFQPTESRLDADHTPTAHMPCHP
jgi:hypothetical protein